MGPQPIGTARRARGRGRAATAAGLEVVDLRRRRLRVEFFDVGAVVYFLRKVIWTVPDFDVERYRDRLRALHERIQADGASSPPRRVPHRAKGGPDVRRARGRRRGDESTSVSVV